MAFQIGDKVVYPNQGVGTIESISSRFFGSRHEQFYLLRLTSQGMTVMVPFSHAEEIGLRQITRNGELARVLKFLAGGACPCSQDWKERFKANSEKMNHGGLIQIAEVVKTLLLLQRDKPLSFRERKMLDLAHRLLVTELSVSRGMTEAQAASLVREALAQDSLDLPAAG